MKHATGYHLNRKRLQEQKRLQQAQAAHQQNQKELLETVMGMSSKQIRNHASQLFDFAKTNGQYLLQTFKELSNESQNLIMQLAQGLGTSPCFAMAAIFVGANLAGISGADVANIIYNEGLTPEQATAIGEGQAFDLCDSANPLYSSCTHFFGVQSSTNQTVAVGTLLINGNVGGKGNGFTLGAINTIRECLTPQAILKLYISVIGNLTQTELPAVDYSQKCSAVTSPAWYGVQSTLEFMGLGNDADLCQRFIQEFTAAGLDCQDYWRKVGLDFTYFGYAAAALAGLFLVVATVYCACTGKCPSFACDRTNRNSIV
jgi:hypothetical protein